MWRLSRKALRESYGHVAGITAAVVGAARYKTGRSLLRYALQLSSAPSADELFLIGWRFINRANWLFLGREISGNRYQIDWQNFAFMQLLAGIKKRYPEYLPRLALSGDGLAELSERKLPIVVVTVHSRLEAVINRVLSEIGAPYAVIAINEDIEVPSRWLGMRGDKIDVIVLSSDVLLSARNRLRQGKAVITCVDSTVREPGTMFHDLFISERAFAFAERLGAATIFANTRLSADGTILVEFARPDESKPYSASTLATHFIEFLSLCGDMRKWRKEPPQGRLRPGAKNYDNFWIRRPKRDAPVRSIGAAGQD